MHKLVTYGDAIFAQTLEQDLLHEIVEVAGVNWASATMNCSRAFLTIQTLAMRAIAMNAATNQVFQNLATGHEKEAVHADLQGLELIEAANHEG